MLRLFSMFSGVGGFSYAAKTYFPNRFELAGFCENDPYCQAVLKKHYPNVICHPDARTLDPSVIADQSRINVLAFTPPCQSASILNRSNYLSGIADETKTGLTKQGLRCIRANPPQYVVFENVPAFRLCGAKTLLRELAEIGYDAEWAYLRVSDLGGCHNRPRLYLVAAKTSHTDGIRKSRIELPRWAEPAACKNELSEDWRRFDDAPLVLREDDGLSERLHKCRRLLKDASTEREFEKAEKFARYFLYLLWFNNYFAATSSNMRVTRNDLRKMSCEMPWGRKSADAERNAILQRLRDLWGVLFAEELAQNEDLFAKVQSRVGATERFLEVGRANRVDKLRAIGNAVCPQVAAIALNRVLQLESLRVK